MHRVATFGLVVASLGVLGCGAEVSVEGELGTATFTLRTERMQVELPPDTVASCVQQYGTNDEAPPFDVPVLVHNLRLRLDPSIAIARAVVTTNLNGPCSAIDGEPLITSTGMTEVDLDVAEAGIALGAGDVVKLYAERPSCEAAMCSEVSTASLELDLEPL